MLIIINNTMKNIRPKMIYFEKDKWMQCCIDFYSNELPNSHQIHLFQMFTGLKNLYLEGSNVKRIEASSFDQLQSLTRLTLKNVESIPEFLFQNLKNLKKLNIYDCTKLRLNKNHFHGLNDLELLSFDGQFIGEIDNLINIKNFNSFFEHFIKIDKVFISSFSCY